MKRGVGAASTVASQRESGFRRLPKPQFLDTCAVFFLETEIHLQLASRQRPPCNVSPIQLLDAA
jgi:hypothetical protein